MPTHVHHRMFSFLYGGLSIFPVLRRLCARGLDVECILCIGNWPGGDLERWQEQAMHWLLIIGGESDTRIATHPELPWGNRHPLRFTIGEGPVWTAPSKASSLDPAQSVRCGYTTPDNGQASFGGSRESAEHTCEHSSGCFRHWPFKFAAEALDEHCRDISLHTRGTNITYTLYRQDEVVKQFRLARGIGDRSDEPRCLRRVFGTQIPSFQQDHLAPERLGSVYQGVRDIVFALRHLHRSQVLPEGQGGERIHPPPSLNQQTRTLLDHSQETLRRALSGPSVRRPADKGCLDPGQQVISRNVLLARSVHGECDRLQE